MTWRSYFEKTRKCRLQSGSHGTSKMASCVNVPSGAPAGPKGIRGVAILIWDGLEMEHQGRLSVCRGSEACHWPRTEPSGGLGSDFLCVLFTLKTALSLYMRVIIMIFCFGRGHSECACINVAGRLVGSQQWHHVSHSEAFYVLRNCFKFRGGGAQCPGWSINPLKSTEGWFFVFIASRWPIYVMLKSHFHIHSRFECKSRLSKGRFPSWSILADRWEK